MFWVHRCDDCLWPDNGGYRMREIKFRAWDKPRNAMIQWFSEFFSDTSPVTGYGPEVDFNGPEMIIMQFTGLRDKNGTEIYEGDIIRNIGVTQEVVFNTISAAFEMRNGYHLRQINLCYEVIGNIHENLKLLEDK